MYFNVSLIGNKIFFFLPSCLPLKLSIYPDAPVNKKKKKNSKKAGK